jgi:hypothetical protein
MRLLFISVLCCFAFAGNSQDFTWWAQSVKWDGISHWSRYMLTQPGYMGPNAMPVPRTGNGSIDSVSSIALTGNLHFSKGDNTQNLALYANYALVKNVISFDASWVPYEHFTLSHEIKTKRHVFSQFYYDREAVGDIILNTNFQLLNKWRDRIHLALRIGYRFHAGSGFGLARTSDGPGYHFDLSFGKQFKNSPLKWIGMAGFYTWQIVSDNHRQDDAFLFGNGLEWNTKSLRLQTYVAGYIGYIGNSGDKPVVFRASAEKKLKRSSLLLGFQKGLNDFEYSSVEMGVKYRFNEKTP